MESNQIQLGSTGLASHGKTRGDVVMELMELYRKEGRCVFVTVLDIGQSSKDFLAAANKEFKFNG